MILDGGPPRIGVESTVVDLSGETPALLRPGGVTEAEIRAHIGPLARAAANGEVKSPGMMEKHYAPNLPLRLNSGQAGADEALLAFGADVPENTAKEICNLSPTGDLREAASNLFAMLHTLDRPDDFAAIAVMPVPDEGLGAAINDRLNRAATE